MCRIFFPRKMQILFHTGYFALTCVWKEIAVDTIFFSSSNSKNRGFK